MKRPVYVLIFDHPGCDLEIGIFSALEKAKGKALKMASGFAEAANCPFDPKRYPWTCAGNRWTMSGDEHSEGIAIERMWVR